MGEVILRGKRVRYTDDQAVGKGGEADVYDLGNGEVLKVFKSPAHPDLALDAHARKSAERRIMEHQQKLPALLQIVNLLPPAVVAPRALATDRSGRVVGYAMPFLSGAEVLMKYAQRDIRQRASADDAIATLRHLHATVGAVHAAGAVIGDFNDLNVLVTAGRTTHIIDADSMQFGSFFCATYTTTFVDPLRCDPHELVLTKPHDKDSDWYAFAVMVLQSLLFVGPHGGVAKGVIHGKRPLLRLTIFDPQVRYPKPAVPFNRLPDDLLHHLQQVFMKDLRGVFPAVLLERLRWTTCMSCGAEHARATCPVCSKGAPAAVKETTTMRGSVTATKVFPSGAQAGGRVLRAEVHGGKVMWLHMEGHRLLREGVDLGVSGTKPDRLKFRLRASETIVGYGPRLIMYQRPDRHPELDVDVVDGRSAFDVNQDHIFWIKGNALYRDTYVLGEVVPVLVGNVLRGQTHFWVGPTFGFGLYRAGNVSVAFVFTATQRSLNDSVKLPPISGKLVDATCVFTDKRAWFFSSFSQDTPQGTKIVNRCVIVLPDGTVEAQAEADQGADSWLGRIRGGAAGESKAGGYLLVPTDEGIVQVRSSGGQITESKKFPDTEPFVDSASRLLIGGDGVYVVTSDSITRLVLS